jgi:hypothetical protein
MGICHFEQEIVDQNLQTEVAKLWEHLQDYLSCEAMKQPLHDVEECLLRRLLELGKNLLEQLIVCRAGLDRGKGFRHGGQDLSYHGTKSCSYLSIFGRIDIMRAYYWKKNHEGICPLDAELMLPERRYSYLLTKWAEKGVANSTYDETIATINDILGLELSKGGLETLAKDVSASVPKFYQKKSAPKNEGAILVGLVDCKGIAMVPAERPKKIEYATSNSKVRREKGEKKKGLRRDAVVTADYSIDLDPRTPKEMIEALMKPLREKPAKEMPLIEKNMVETRSPKNKQVLAWMSGKGEAIRELMDRIKKRDPSEKKPIYLQIDGAASLETALQNEINRRGWGKRVQGFCLDIMHTMEYLWKAGTALYGEGSEEREKWVYKEGLALLQGRVGRVIGGLRQILTKRKGMRESSKEILKQVVTYFQNHRHMMCYDKYLKKGYPIGTGVIEGTCRSLVKDRTDRSGMKWTQKGVQAVLHLRAVNQNGHWEEFWKHYVDSECVRLYA